jgi:hypothetical protein
MRTIPPALQRYAPNLPMRKSVSADSVQVRDYKPGWKREHCHSAACPVSMAQNSSAHQARPVTLKRAEVACAFRKWSADC